MKLLGDFLLWLWQSPQNLCGIIYRSISNSNRISVIENNDSRNVDAKVYLQKSNGGITFGKYIFINQDYIDKEIIIKHECGHVKQSKILGPLYLLVIGIPSILHAWINKYLGCCWKNGEYNYYHFYTEKWANKLMDIE